ncbi:MAG: hypothetical protein COV10_04880 [Candidatus Vogelbacteria bacterium CG10_big_fil_rev_8_21_14_0_10_51_16]|uniref:Uncharacterized protein n=1 Tax=Candidatus Vogelbacteria bacterium CG10_big_fil_rev_8_21_14_0_10_51_16 TaxID=1975045 RepID=A0A2H0REJ8_9BACT|nr:MAG: hypothetical protein COV10_04880 [Candidatus Vogelbacteria bacterium CG10_big_fil_rev_8_21_14_0_10_51_16]
MVAAGPQPANSLAPKNATRLPFTRVTFTAGGSDVVVNGVTVERAGLAVDAAFSGLLLLDENGIQLGVEKTLNSNHQAVVGEPFTVAAGTSRTMTIAGNMASSLTSQAGQVAILKVVGVNTSAALSGSLPIEGAQHTINASLTIGSVTMQRGGIDPGSNVTKELGTAGFTFASVRATAGSAEDLTLRSIRWNQVGSAGSSDLANVTTWVDGTSYDTMVSADGDYYTAVFGDGIKIEKGFSKDISIKGDIVGGSARTIKFNIAKRADLDLMGNLFGYGIKPPATGSTVPTGTTSAFSSSEDPWYYAITVTISAGTITVSSDTAVASQNVAVNLSNQPLGGFKVDVRGEPVSVSSMVFNVTAVGTGQVNDLTNVTLVDANGAVLGGPVDGSGAASGGTITFSDSITFPVGVTTLSLKGKLGTDFVTNDTVRASTTPSTDWTTVRGQTSGNTITPTPSTAITASLMTVRAGALSVSVSSQPSARTVIAGADGFEFSRIILDATQSGEDVRLTSIPLLLTLAGTPTALVGDLTSCELRNSAGSVLTTGTNKVTSFTAAADHTFTFDGTGVTIPKGTSMDLSVRCDVSSDAAASGTIAWGVKSAFNITSASGLDSGQTVAESATSGNGNAMTLSAGGSYTVTADSSSDVNYRAVRAGTEVILAAFNFTAGTAENVVLKQIALQLGNTASNSPSNLVGDEVSFWDGSTKLGTARFVEATNHATSSAISLSIPRGTSKRVTVKGDLEVINSINSASIEPGSFLAITYDGDNVGLNGNYASGVDSGSNISSGTTSDVTTNGVRIFSAVPEFRLLTNSVALTPSSELYKFTVTNPSTTHDLALKQLSFLVSTTGGAVTGFTLEGDGVLAKAASTDASGATGSQVVEILFDPTSNAKLVQKGTTKTFALKASTIADGSSVGETLNVALMSDTSYPSLAELMGTVTSVNAGSGNTDNIIWTPFSSTTPGQANSATESNLDWTNGYGLPFYNASGLLLADGQNLPTQSFTRPQ